MAQPLTRPGGNQELITLDLRELGKLGICQYQKIVLTVCWSISLPGIELRFHCNPTSWGKYLEGNTMGVELSPYNLGQKIVCVTFKMLSALSAFFLVQ